MSHIVLCFSLVTKSEKIVTNIKHRCDDLSFFSTCTCVVSTTAAQNYTQLFCFYNLFEVVDQTWSINTEWAELLSDDGKYRCWKKKRLIINREEFCYHITALVGVGDSIQYEKHLCKLWLINAADCALVMHLYAYIFMWSWSLKQTFK